MSSAALTGCVVGITLAVFWLAGFIGQARSRGSPIANGDLPEAAPVVEARGR